MKVFHVSNLDYFIRRTVEKSWPEDFTIYFKLPRDVDTKIMQRITNACKKGTPPQKLFLLCKGTTFTLGGFNGFLTLLQLDSLSNDTHLSLEEFTLNNEYLTMVINVINEKKKTFTLLDLQGTGLSIENVSTILSRGYGHLLNFSDNLLGDAAMEIVAQHIENNTLNDQLLLRFWNCGITDAGLDMLINALLKANKLPSNFCLDLAYNHISEKGALTLIAALPEVYSAMNFRIGLSKNDISITTLQELERVSKTNDAMSLLHPLMILYSQKYNDQSPFSLLNDDIFYKIFGYILPEDKQYKFMDYIYGFNFFKSYPRQNQIQQATVEEENLYSMQLS